MKRYLFELLAYIEKNGSKAYSIRELSDNLSGKVHDGTASKKGYDLHFSRR